MNKIKSSIVINRSAQEVFNFTIDPQNTPKWVESVVVEETNETPPKLGTIYKNRDAQGNWREFEITAFDEGVMFEMTKANDNNHVVYTFVPITDNQCKLEYKVWSEGELHNTFTPEILETILRDLKAFIEGQ